MTIEPFESRKLRPEEIETSRDGGVRIALMLLEASGFDQSAALVKACMCLHIDRSKLLKQAQRIHDLERENENLKNLI